MVFKMNYLKKCYMISDSDMEDSKESLKIKINAENSDNNTENLGGDADNLRKELIKTLYEMHIKELEIKEYRKDLVEKDEKIQSLEKDIENLLKESDGNERLTFVHEILKKQKEQSEENSDRLSSCVHQQEIEIISLKSRLGELTSLLEKNKGEIPAERNDDGDIRKLLEEAKKENVELKAKNESLEEEIYVLIDLMKKEKKKLADFKMLYEESNDKNHKLQALNENLRKEKDKAVKKASTAQAHNASYRFKKVKVPGIEGLLMKTQKKEENLNNALHLMEEELEEENRKLRELDDKYQTEKEDHNIEVKELQDKIKNLEVELDSIYHHETNSNHFNEEQLQFTNYKFNFDLNDETCESEGLGVKGKKRRRVVKEREDHSDSEELNQRRSVFSRLGKNKMKNK